MLARRDRGPGRRLGALVPSPYARPVDPVLPALDGASVAGIVPALFGRVDGTRRLFADLDGNGVVDAADVDLAAANLGTWKA